mgnify:CR=1 FL=1
MYPNILSGNMPMRCKSAFLLVLFVGWAGYALAAERAPSGKSGSSAVATPACKVAEWRAMGLTLHDPAERRVRARNWLLAQARGCSLEQLNMIRDNNAVWMGTAGTPDLEALVEEFIETRSTDGQAGLKNQQGGSPVPAETQRK